MKAKRIVILLIVLMFVSQALAAPTVDGLFTTSDGYTTGHYLNLNIEGYGIAADQGQLWTHQDSSNNLYVCIIQPTSVVDNSYGSTRVGWGSKNHEFIAGGGGGNLIGSDKAEISIRDGIGDLLFQFDMDYIAEQKGVTTGTNPYVSAGVQTNSEGPGYIESQGKVDYPAGTSYMAEWATSQEYNMNQYYSNFITDSPLTDSPTSYNVTNPAYADWIFEVIYEFRIDGSALVGYTGDLSVDVLHDSPNKLGKNKVWTEIDGVIPEPCSMVLGGIGVGLVGWLRRRRVIS